MKIAKKSSFDENDYKFLQFLQLDEDLKKYLQNKRSSIGIPNNGLIFSKTSLKEILQKDNLFWDRLVNFAKSLMGFYSLPFSWLDTAINLILFDIATPPNKKLYPALQIKPKREPPGVLLIVKEGISITELSKLISKSSRLERELAKLPKTPLIKAKNIHTGTKILFLRRKNLKYNDIAKSFPNTSALTYTDTNRISSRFKDYYKEYLNKKGLRSLPLEITLLLDAK